MSEAVEVRGQQRPGGTVLDVLTFDAQGLVTGHLAAHCLHGKSWPEGDAFEADGGDACEPCLRATREAR